MSQAAPAAGVSPENTSRPSSSVIVVGYSAAPEGRAALSRAVTEARIRNSELLVVHSADEELAGLKAELAGTGIRHRIHGADQTLEPAEALINAAESSGAEFIIIGLRRRSPVGKRLLGSNAQRVLLDASCPVLAVKADVSS
jgi:nucleotide-binding universal stress UspA family protein